MGAYMCQRAIFRVPIMCLTSTCATAMMSKRSQFGHVALASDSIDGNPDASPPILQAVRQFPLER